MPYREKRITSGDYFEVELFPVSFEDTRQNRREKVKESKIKQRNLNNKNAKKHLIRLINTNFNNQDMAAHLTYSNDHLPESADQARRDIANYIRRVKSLRKKMGLTDLKYIAVIECKDPEDGNPGVRIHHHIIMNEGLTRDEAEALWQKGRCNTDRLQADEFGYEGLARYMTKDPHGSKRWCQSKNLQQPEIHVNDHKFSKRKIEQLALCQGDREEVEKLYPGYSLTAFKPEVNDVTGQISIYIKMRKLSPAPAGRKGNGNAKNGKRSQDIFTG